MVHARRIRYASNLWKKKLGRVPNSVWELTTLESLILADDDLSDLSDRTLDLGHNRLTRLPDAVVNLLVLPIFSLHDNALKVSVRANTRLTD
jgi:hypothetical protein